MNTYIAVVLHNGTPKRVHTSSMQRAAELCADMGWTLIAVIRKPRTTTKGEVA